MKAFFCDKTGVFLVYILRRWAVAKRAKSESRIMRELKSLHRIITGLINHST